MDRGNAARLILATLLAASIGASAARSETLMLGGRTVIVEPPSSYCALDPARPAEADLIAFNEKMQRPRNHVVMQLASCDELADFRAGKRESFDRYGQIFTAASDDAVKSVVGYSRAEFLTEAARELPKLDSGPLIDEVTNKLRQTAGSDVSGIRFLGVLKQDGSGIYFGVAIGDTPLANQPVASTMGVVGLTLVNQVSVSLGLYQINVGPEAMPGLLATVQQTLATLVQANVETEAREASGWFWYGFDLEGIARGALIGGLIVAAIGLAGWLVSRRRKNRAGK